MTPAPRHRTSERLKYLLTIHCLARPQDCSTFETYTHSSESHATAQLYTIQVLHS